LKTGSRREEIGRESAKQPSRESRDDDEEEAKADGDGDYGSGGGGGNDNDEAKRQTLHPTKRIRIHTYHLRALRERNARLCSQDDLDDEGT
jgi:hypothetical protein